MNTKRPRGQKNKDMLSFILKATFPHLTIVEEHVFHPTRKWRFDFAIPEIKLAIEYQGHGATGGGGHVGGHASMSGMAGDCEKINQAQALGWTVLLFTALHFQPADRIKHKLTAPLMTIEEIGKRLTLLYPRP